jgi:hypothetical protein
MCCQLVAEIGCISPSYNSIFVILQERSEVKGLQNVHLLCRWMEACICARESWLTFDGMTRPEIFRSSQTLNKEFLGVGSRLASRQEPWAENGLFLQNLPLPWVLVLQGCHITFLNSEDWG